jgi:hypothetical protein
MDKPKYYILDEIRRTNKISDYLASKGVPPYTRGNSNPNRLSYCCPLHKETQPSFMLYLDGPYENYFCFGCKRGGGIVSLYSEMENVSFREALSVLGKDLDLSSEGELDLLLRKIKEDNHKSQEKAEMQLAELSLNFSILAYTILERTNFDSDAVEFLEKMFKVIDSYIWREDFESLEKCYRMVLDKKLFNNKIKEFKQKQKEKKKQEIIGVLENDYVEENIEDLVI